MKRTLAFILALGLMFAPIAFAGNQETEVSAGGYLTGTLANLLKTTQTLVNELAADHDSGRAAVAELVADHDTDTVVLGTWETLIEETAADHDTDNTTLAVWETTLETALAKINELQAVLANWEIAIEAATNVETIDLNATPAVLATVTLGSVAANLTADITPDSVAANLTATTVPANLSADTVLGSGTELDPSISLTI